MGDVRGFRAAPLQFIPERNLDAGCAAVMRVLRQREPVMSYTYTNVPIGQIAPHPRNARTHAKKQIRQIAASIRAVGFAAPVLIDEHKVLIAGHGRLEAAKSLGMSSIPAIVVSGLSDAKKRALLLADNRIALSAGWGRELLAIELAALPDLLVEDDLDISVTGSNQPRSTHCMLTLRMGRKIPLTSSATVASMDRRSRSSGIFGSWANTA